MFLMPKRLVFAVVGAIASGVVMFAGKWYADREADIRQSERFETLMQDVREIKTNQRSLLIFQGVTAERLDNLEALQQRYERATR